MATIGRLTVALSANSAQLAQDLNKSRRNVNTWASRIEQRARQVAKIMAGIATAAVAAFTAFGVAGLREINNMAGKIDEIAKAAGNLRFDVGDLQELRFIADQTGTSFGTLESSIQRMNRQLAAGSERTAEAMRTIGFSIDQVMSMNPADRFKTIAQAISEIEDEGLQTATMMELFGRTGGDMLNLLNANFNELGETFEKMGIRLTNEQAKAVEAYNDAKNRLSTLFSGFKMQMTANLTPVMTDILGFIEDFAGGMGGMDQVANRAAVGVLNAVVAMIDGLAALLDTIDAIDVGWNKIARIGNIATGGVAGAYESVYGMFGENAISRTAGQFRDASFNSAMGNDSRLSSVEDRSQRRANSVDRARDFIEQHIDELQNNAKTLERMDSQLENLFTGNESLFGRIPDRFDAAVERMMQQNDQASVKVELNLTTDRGQLVGEVVASPQMARKMQEIAAREINNTARGVAA